MFRYNSLEYLFVSRNSSMTLNLQLMKTFFKRGIGKPSLFDTRNIHTDRCLFSSDLMNLTFIVLFIHSFYTEI